MQSGEPYNQFTVIKEILECNTYKLFSTATDVTPFAPVMNVVHIHSKTDIITM